jgi:hypothetical protein
MRIPESFGKTSFRRFCWALLALVFLSSAFPAHAQYSTAAILGSVSTGDGKPVSDAHIRWMQDGLSISVDTNSMGQFGYFLALPGSHTFHFEHSSTPEIGVFEAAAASGSAIYLRAVLRYGNKDGLAGDRWDISLRATGGDAWEPERVLSEKRFDSLPNAGHIWSFLNHTEPSVVAEIYDIGGMNSESQFLIGVHGSSWTQNRTNLNGLTVDHPAGDVSLLFPDMTTMETIVYSVGDSASSHSGPGAHLSYISKHGERELHGQVHSYLQAGALQNVNVTERNRFFGITESDERWRHFVDSGVQLGGPLGRLPWTYFGSFTNRNMEKWIRNHALPVSANANLGAFNLRGQISPKDQFGIDVFWQKLHEPESGSSPQVTREASVDRKQNYRVFQLAWTRRFSDKSLLDACLGMNLGDDASGFQEASHGQSREDIFPGFALWGVPAAPPYLAMVEMLSNTVRGSAPLTTSYDARSFEASAIYSTIGSGFGDSNHQITLEAKYGRRSLRQRQRSIENVNLLFFKGAPNSVRILNTPRQSQDRIDQLELYGSDRLSLGRFNVTLGITADSSRGMNILGSRESANSLRWNDIGGRVGIAFRAMDRFPLTLRAGIAQISDQPITGTWNAVNPDGLGVRLFAWDDINGDGQFQPGENKQLLKVYGSPYSRMDPGLKNPKTNEIVLSLTQSGVAGLTFNAFGYRRTQNNLHSLVNQGVPFSAYTPVKVFDPGPDGIVGTGDDGFITAFNQNLATLGQDSYLLTNPAGLNGYSEGFELRLNFSSRKVQAEGSITHYRAVASTGPGVSARENDTSALLGVFDDPNKSVLARGSTYFDRGTLGRIWATAELMGHLRWAMILSYQDGLPYGRYLPVGGLNQGVVGILASQRGPGEAGSNAGFMSTHYETMDLRVANNFVVKRGKLTAIVDVFNLANRAQLLTQTSVTAPTMYWRIPLRFQPPRSIQLGLTYKW